MWQNSNFVSIHQIKNVNLNPDAKMSVQDDGYKMFEFRPIFPVFGQNNYDLNGTFLRKFAKTTPIKHFSVNSMP